MHLTTPYIKSNAFKNHRDNNDQGKCSPKPSAER